MKTGFRFAIIFFAVIAAEKFASAMGVAPSTPVITVTANGQKDLQIDQGTNYTVSYTITKAAACMIDYVPGLGSSQPAESKKIAALNGSFSSSLSGTYKITCSKGPNQSSQSVSIKYRQASSVPAAQQAAAQQAAAQQAAAQQAAAQPEYYEVCGYELVTANEPVWVYFNEYGPEGQIYGRTELQYQYVTKNEYVCRSYKR